MASLTNTWETKIGNAVLRGVSVTFPSTVYLALFTASPGETGSTTDEVSGGSYARQAVTFAEPSTDGLFINTGDVVFPTASASWGTVSHFAVCTADTGGEVILHGEIKDVTGDPAPKSIGAGDSFTFPDNAIDATFA